MIIWCTWAICQKGQLSGEHIQERKQIERDNVLTYISLSILHFKMCCRTQQQLTAMIVHLFPLIL